MCGRRANSEGCQITSIFQGMLRITIIGRLRSFRCPEWTHFHNLPPRRVAGDSIFLNVGNIIGVQPSGKCINRKKFSQNRQVNDPFFSSRFETAPIPNVFFRPEEVHGTSVIGPVSGPFPNRYRSVPYQTFRFSTLDQTILHLHPDG